eukprot:7532682-Pyramimonas_sp.AAC.3
MCIDITVCTITSFYRSCGPVPITARRMLLNTPDTQSNYSAYIVITRPRLRIGGIKGRTRYTCQGSLAEVGIGIGIQLVCRGGRQERRKAGRTESSRLTLGTYGLMLGTGQTAACISLSVPVTVLDFGIEPAWKSAISLTICARSLARACIRGSDTCLPAQMMAEDPDRPACLGMLVSYLKVKALGGRTKPCFSVQYS